MAREVAEWIGKSDDDPVPPSVKLRQFERDNGCCCKCGRKLYPQDKPQCYHIKAIKNGGENRESNLQTLCYWCHRNKTREDVAEKSVVARKRTKHFGIKPKRQGFKGWRKMNGEIVWSKQEG